MNHPILSKMRPTDNFKPLSNILGTFIEYLRGAGETAARIRCLRREAEHFLNWLDLRSIAVESVDNAVLCSFRRHDCDCCCVTQAERRRLLASCKRGFMTGALRLVQFLEQHGCIFHLGELDANLRYLENFIARCTAEGYGTDSLISYRSSCRHILIWLHRSRISIADVDEQILERFVHHDCVCPGNFKSPRRHIDGSRYDYPFRCFVKYLNETGELSIEGMIPENPIISPMQPFAQWLRRHRAIGERSIRRHCRHAALLVSDIGRNPQNSSEVRQALLKRYEGVSKFHAQSLASSMRMYLRYLSANHNCSPSLIDAVPAALTYQLSSLPRYISVEDVERVIACCDVSKPAGLRDRAILLLLARLALRAGDIIAMTLEDIDWRNALVRVCGKSKRQVNLPLPQDVGDAILDYIENARPRITHDKVFLRARAPHRPLAGSVSVTSIVMYALKRAGLEHVRPQGAYLFRHSSATHMLRSGQSLEVISTVLRHKSMDTSSIYAKTDKSMLLEVAQPWIGGLS